MKDKIITIKPKGITQKQWVNFIIRVKFDEEKHGNLMVLISNVCTRFQKTILWGIGAQIQKKIDEAAIILNDGKYKKLCII